MFFVSCQYPAVFCFVVSIYDSFVNSRSADKRWNLKIILLNIFFLLFSIYFYRSGCKKKQRKKNKYGADSSHCILSFLVRMKKKYRGQIKEAADSSVR